MLDLRRKNFVSFFKVRLKRQQSNNASKTIEHYIISGTTYQF